MTAPRPVVDAAPMTLRCPKCHGDMATYERSGVVVDQCRECRGIWLDRGELDRLVDLESRHGFAMPADRDPRPPRDARGDRYDRDRYGGGDRDDRYDRDRDDRGRYDGGQPRRKRSLFGELFEGLGD